MTKLVKILLYISNLDHIKQRLQVAKHFILSNNNHHLNQQIRIRIGIITLISKELKMNEQERRDLIYLVDQDKIHIEKFLQYHNLKVKDNKVTILFSDGEVDKTTIHQQSFVNLCELQYEPSLVKVEFIIQELREAHGNIKDLLESLLNKTTTRGWHDNPYDSLGNSKAIEDDYNCFQSIKIDSQGFDCKVILIGAIGCFN